MSRSRKIAIFVIIPLCLVLAAAVAVFAPYLYNNSVMRSMNSWLYGEMSRLSDAGGGDIVVVEQQSACGKLCGNGNGMQFFSAVLLHASSDVRLEIIDQAIDALQLEFDDAGALEINDASPDIPCVDHAYIQFDHFGEDDMGKYIVVYIFDSDSGSDFDIRAH